MTHDYKRNGTTTLFAALSMLDARSSRLHAASSPSGVDQFLTLIEEQTPAAWTCT